MSILEKILEKITSFFKEVFYLFNLNFKNRIQFLVRFLLFFGGIGAIVYGLSSTLFLTPQKVVEVFYHNLGKKKFDKAFGYVLPEERKKVESKIEYLKLVDETNIYDLKINLVETKEREAIVEVNGKFEVKSQGTVRNGEIHNKINLVKRGLFWYIKSFAE